MQNGGMCRCSHHKIIPALVFLFGLDFLLGALSILTPGAVNIIWPIIVILASIQMIADPKCKCCMKGRMDGQSSM